MGLPTAFVNKTATVNATSTANATVFTHSSALKNPDGTAGLGGVLDRLYVYNSDTISHDISLFKVPSGGSVGSSALIDRLTLPTKTPFTFEGPAYGASGYFYAMQMAEAASSSGGVYVTADYHEMS